MIRFLYWLTARLPCRIINGEHGEPYLERYFLFRLAGFTAYIHRFVDNDPDRGLHDHPWSWSCSLILAGGYHELRATRVDVHTSPDISLRYHRPGRFNVIRGDDFHRIILHWSPLSKGQMVAEAWTLFVHRPRTKGWGFIQPTIRADFRKKKPVIGWTRAAIWTPGVLPVYKPFTLTRHCQTENWHRTAPKGRDWNRAQRKEAA